MPAAAHSRNPLGVCLEREDLALVQQLGAVFPDRRLEANAGAVILALACAEVALATLAAFHALAGHGKLIGVQGMVPEVVEQLSIGGLQGWGRQEAL